MKNWMIWLGPLLAVLLASILTQVGVPRPIVCTAAVTCWVAIWWIFEPIPIPATSLIPLALFPLLGVLEPGQVASAFGHPLVLLMLGGFMLSAAMERSGAHRRLALGMVHCFGGGNGRRLVLGFMAASALLSMWISNAATTLMLLPIAMAVVSQTQNRKLQIRVLLGIAYAASIGGVGTPIGSPPNLVFMDVYARSVGTPLSFVDWMQLGLPVVAVMLPLAGLWLSRGLSDSEAIELPAVGSWKKSEWKTLLVFGITAALWMTRTQPWGGWTSAALQLGFPLPYASDASVALLGATLLFVLSGEPGQKLLDWETAQKIPWGILLLFAGGICIASAFQTSGLSTELGIWLGASGTWPVLLVMICICTAVTFLTEVTSNTATTQLLLPVLATAALAAAVEPKIFLVPATISASFAFMLPVATPPNAIVFGSEKFSIGDMIREGLALNLLGIVVTTAVCYLLVA